MRRWPTSASYVIAAAAAGADFIAPLRGNGMTKSVLSAALDAAGFTDTAIMSHSPVRLFFYGPFREAAGTGVASRPQNVSNEFDEPP